MKTRNKVYKRRAKLEVLMEHTELEALRRLATRQSISMSRLVRESVLDILRRQREHQ